MTRNVLKVTGSCLLFLVVGWAVAAAPSQEKSAASGSVKGGDETLARLLDEVHQLRVALERSASDNSRFQMAIERMRIQQAHVDGIQRELSGIRSEISNIDSSRETTSGRIKDLEERLDSETGPDYAALQDEIKRVKQAIVGLDRDLQSRRTRESELTGLLRMEENRLHMMDHQLDELTKPPR